MNISCFFSPFLVLVAECHRENVMCDPIPRVVIVLAWHSLAWRAAEGAEKLQHIINAEVNSRRKENMKKNSIGKIYGIFIENITFLYEFSRRKCETMGKLISYSNRILISLCSSRTNI